jgi:hypothetical protein
VIVPGLNEVNTITKGNDGGMVECELLQAIVEDEKLIESSLGIELLVYVGYDILKGTEFLTKLFDLFCLKFFDLRSGENLLKLVVRRVATE